tara:strand:- start:399 stop:590 length:192 start_codon:yes stop_codon:yes gene_type:complete
MFVIISSCIFSIALLLSVIIVVIEENKIKNEEKYNLYGNFGGIPSIAQIRRKFGTVAMGPDYY